MRLLVIRHGLSMDKQKFARTGRGGDERPLTSETADIVARAYRMRRRRRAARSTPMRGRPRREGAVLAWLTTPAQLQRAARR